jgi:membrane-bound ClpP family serine protease
MLALGVVLLVVTALLLLAEAHASTGGLIAGAAIVALVAGLTLALLGTGAELGVVLVVATGAGVTSAGALVVATRSMLRVRRLRPRAGPEAMIGHLGVVRNGDTGRVFVDGALWRAQPSVLETESGLHDGDQIVVERVNGLTLCVRRAEGWELEA